MSDGWVDDPSFKKPASDEGWVDDPSFALLSKEESPSLTESGLRGLAQGASLGFADEIVGGLESLLSQKSYKQARDESRANFKKAKDANPVTYGAGEVGGAVGTALIPGVGAAGSAAKLAATGAALGGLGALGASESEDAGGMAKDVAIGSALGGAGGALGAGAGKFLSGAKTSAGEGLKKFAEKKAFESLGGVKRATDEALNKGQLFDTGRYLLDEGIVTPLASKATIGERISSKLGKTANELDDVIARTAEGRGLDDAQKLALDEAMFKPHQAGAMIKTQLRDEFSHIPEEVLKPRLDMVDQWLSKEGPMSIKDAQAFKRQMQTFINDSSYWKGNPNASQDTLMKIRRSIKEGIESNADAYAKVANDPTGRVKSLNQEMGKLLSSDDIVQDRISRDIANRSISLTDTIAGAGGFAGAESALGGSLKGAALALGNKVVRHRGDQLAATGADKLSKALLGSPRMSQLAESNPTAFKALVFDLSKRVTPERPLSAAAGELDRDSSRSSSYTPQGREKDDDGAKERFLKEN